MGNAQHVHVKELVKRAQPQVFIVTGANRGIGKEIVRALYSQGSTIILACRNEKAALEAIQDIENSQGQQNNQHQGSMIFLHLDLSDIASIEKFVQEFRKLNLPLHVLINNASVYGLPSYQTNKQGIEMQFMVNYLGHFLLTQLLVPVLLENVPSRVICVSSIAHEMSIMRSEFQIAKLPPKEEDYHPRRNYGLSKLSLIMFMYRFSMIYGNRGLYGISCHPGIIKTNLAENDFLLHSLRKVSPFLLVKSPEEGAKNVLFCALAKNIKCGYYVNCKLSNPSKDARNKHFSLLLWKLSEKLTNIEPAQNNTNFNLLGQSDVCVAKYEWKPDQRVSCCMLCDELFTTTNRKHHCRFCGKIICQACSPTKIPEVSSPQGPFHRSCNTCVILRRWNEIW